MGDLGSGDLGPGEEADELIEGASVGLPARVRRRRGEVWVATALLPADSAGGDAGPRLADLLAAVSRRAEDTGAAALHWESDEPAAMVDQVAAAVGLDERRDVLQLRRSLPLEAALVEATAKVAVRPIRLGTADEAAWVRANNRAFADHPDQGHESVANLRRAAAEPWFDPAGFLLADSPPGVDDGGDLDAFCWTKVHPADGDEPVRGEIYVIGIDPSAAGRGLGRALVVAGLTHLAEAGIETAMLYVDATNAPARLLYDRLGFSPHQVRRVRSRHFGSDPPQTTE